MEYIFDVYLWIELDLDLFVLTEDEVNQSRQTTAAAHCTNIPLSGTY